MAVPPALLATIVPDAVEVQEWFGEAPGADLLPEEEPVVSGAAESRRRQFSTVRSCARVCLARLGEPAVPILPGRGGAPRWPATVRGSMTHCAGYAAAAVGPADRMSAIGIDAEPDRPLPDGVLALVATQTERSVLAGAPPVPGGPSRDRLLFSAKEAVYKAWFPVVGEWLDPQEAEIVFHPRESSFTATLSRPGLVLAGRRLDTLSGRWARDRGVLVTAVVLP
jgi:4'-phosphopantetheinyl transferase EntD